MPDIKLTPADIDFCGGSPIFALSGEPCFAADSLARTRQIFLAGNQLPRRWENTHQFQIAEVGFNFGLNFLVTWSEWRRAAPDHSVLQYFAAEHSPLRRPDLTLGLDAWPELKPLSDQLLDAWPMLTPGFHRRHFDQGRVILTLMFGDAAESIRQSDVQADAIYFDRLMPLANIVPRRVAIARALPKIASLRSTLVIVDTDPELCSVLSTAGFILEAQGNRATGHFRPNRNVRARTNERSVTVIGAGIAGCSVANKLAERDWQVRLIDRHPAPAGEASGNLAGAYGPTPAVDDSVFGRVTRAGFLYGLDHLKRLALHEFAVDGHACGMLHLTKDRAQQKRIAELFDQPDFLRWVDQAQASEIAGQRVADCALYFPTAGWINPASLCAALCRQRAIQICHATVKVVCPMNGRWQVIGTDSVLFETAHVVFACGSARFPQLSRLPLQNIRGQVSYLPATQPLNCIVGGAGYVIPSNQGRITVGATFDPDNLSTQCDDDSHRQNIRHLNQLLPDWPSPQPGNCVGRAALRCTTPDHLPIIGPIPDFDQPLGSKEMLHRYPRHQGLWGCLGFGSRGLVWTHLAAELLACQMSGEPLPMEIDLVSALDPARFWFRQQRQAPKS